MGQILDWCTLVKDTPFHILVIEADGTIILVNRPVEGYTIDELIGGSFYDYFSGSTESGIKKAITRVLQSGEPMVIEVVVLRPEGEKSRYACHVNPVRSGVSPSRVLLTLSEISVQKQGEGALIEDSKRLGEIVEFPSRDLAEAEEERSRQERLAFLGRLAGGLGHELRNPLGVISNAVYYLQRTLDVVDETTKEYLEIISAEVGNAERIVADFLDFARARPIERGEINLAELADQVLWKHPPPERVQTKIEFPSDLPYAYVDRRQIEQVLTNLILNAYQSMVQEDRLGPQAEGSLLILAQVEKDMVSISIGDNGCGIPEANLEKIFEPLFTTKQRGVGFGLAVSKTLIEANGGSIKVESQEGAGSTFTIILPTR